LSLVIRKFVCCDTSNEIIISIDEAAQLVNARLVDRKSNKRLSKSSTVIEI